VGGRSPSSKFRPVAACAIILLLLAGACGRMPAPTPNAPAGSGTGGNVGNYAPDFAGIAHWINSEPLSMESLRGKVVLIDFWTYTCVNCIRTLPFLNSWHEKYADRGLTIVGVHSPEFEFEKHPEHVAAAVERHDLRYPIAQDDEMQTWRAYRNRFWPAKYLVGADGVVRYVHFGEGAYEETERQIRLALVEAGYDVGDVPLGGVEAPALDPSARAITRELYGGYERNYGGFGRYAGQDTYYEGPDRTALYEDPGGHEHNVWYLHGLWRNEREAIVHARATEDLEDYLAFRFRARSVNVVMHPAETGAYDVYLEIDGRPLRPDEAGADVVFDERGSSLVRVDEPRMYALVRLPQAGDRELALRSNAEGFSMYAVTFGAYVEGP
jgi:thiol-disulfide isomerase/thioredoxin